MGLLADANLNALKAKEFWAGVHSSIDKAGRWGLYISTVLALGLIGAFAKVEPMEIVGAIAGIITIATGVEATLTRKKANEKVPTDNPNPVPNGNTDSK